LEEPAASLPARECCCTERRFSKYFKAHYEHGKGERLAAIPRAKGDDPGGLRLEPQQLAY
jgi:hypothetical protein